MNGTKDLLQKEQASSDSNNLMYELKNIKLTKILLIFNDVYILNYPCNNVFQEDHIYQIFTQLTNFNFYLLILS